MMTTAIINQKTAIVTGCSQPDSLGAAICLDLLQRGYKIFATARRVETMGGLAAEGCNTFQLDVTDKETIRRAAEQVEQIAGRLDLLVNVAGIATFSPILDLDLEVAALIYNTNTLGPIQVIQGFSKLLVKTANDSSIPRDNIEGDVNVVGIINIGSAAEVGLPWYAAYSGSKSQEQQAALQSMTHCMRYELEPLNVKVLHVHLGGVKTALVKYDLSIPSLLPPQERSGFYENYESEITQALTQIRKEGTTNSPLPSKVASEILQYHYRGRYPAGGIWTGSGSIIIKYVVGWLPCWLTDGVMRKLGAVNLIKIPTY